MLFYCRLTSDAVLFMRLKRFFTLFHLQPDARITTKEKALKYINTALKNLENL